MRLIDTYILREMIPPALAALFAFVVLITGHVLFTIVDVIAGKGVRFESILRFAALKAPEAAVLALPVATLLGCALALNRLASDNELSPLLAGGVSGLRLMVPAATLGIVATLLSLSMKELAVPYADRRATTLYREMILRQKTLAFKPDRFLDAGQRWVFIARQVDTDNDTLHGLRVLMKQPGAFPCYHRAETACFTDRALRAQNVTSYWFSFPSALDIVTSEQLDIDLGALPASAFGGEAMRNQTIRALLDQRAQARAGPTAAARELDLEIHTRLAMIAACFVFSLLAAPIALRFGRGQSLAGVLATLVLAFAYFVIMLGMKILGGNGVLPVPVAAWSQNCILVIVALIAMRRL